MPRMLTKRELRRLIGNIREIDDPTIELLHSLCRTKWFCNVGKSHPRDFLLCRVKTWRAALSRASSLSNVRGPLWAEVMLASKNQRKVRRLNIVRAKAMQAILSSAGRWSGLGENKAENFAYFRLGEDVGYYTGALLVGHAEAILWWQNVVGFYSEGYWPCGWSGSYPGGNLIVY